MGKLGSVFFLLFVCFGVSSLALTSNNRKEAYKNRQKAERRPTEIQRERSRRFLQTVTPTPSPTMSPRPVATQTPRAR